ncbi:MAG: class I SAM-dependent methyltransferase, partial [Chthoniobacterales bacterium]
LLVELGTDRGESYFAFCQSVEENKTGTRCFAVDTWRGDEHSGPYDETTSAEVSAHNRAHYSEFSTLLRLRFEEALAQFAPESIDLLHLDGLHTEQAVRADLAAWLPKLKPGGILLMHDIAVRARGFGVWKVWEELREQGRSYAFVDAPGLGVWQKPPALSLAPPSETLFTAPDNLAQSYRARADDVQRTIWQAWQDGSIRETAIALQTTLQLFHTHDGTHSEENSITTRVGHDAWKDVTFRLPLGAGTAPLRLDFYSALTTIDLSVIRLTSEQETYFCAEDSAGFDRIRLAGDATRLPHSQYLRVQVTGVDPQLHLPAVDVSANEQLALSLRVRVNATKPAGD